MKHDKEKTATIIVVMITSFITTFTGSALNLAIPDMGQHFGAGAALVGWIVTGYMLTVATFSVPWGRVADLTGRKRILAAGLVIFSLTCVASALAPSIVWIIVFRSIQGVGAAMIFSTNTAILISAFPGDKRGVVLGYSVAATYVGLSAGPVLGGVLNHNLGWRSIFIVTFFVAIAALFIAVKMLPSDSHSSRQAGKGGFDMAGSVMYAAMILLTMYGLSEAASGPAYLLVTGAGLAAGVIFVRHELKTEAPVVQIRLFTKNIPYALSNLATLMNYGATFAIGYLLSIYLQVVMGYSSQTAGIILIVQPVIMAVLSPKAGKLSDRISPFKLASAGMGLCAAGVLLCAFLGRESGMAMVLAALIVTGVGFALFSSPNTNAVMSCVEKKDYGVASSLLATMRSLGHTASMVIVTIIVSIFMGSTPLEAADPQLVVSVMHVAFGIYTAICAAGVFISLKRN